MSTVQMVECEKMETLMDYWIIRFWNWEYVNEFVLCDVNAEQ